MSCANHAAVEEELLRCGRCGNEFCADCIIFLDGRALCAACKDDQLLDVVSGIDRGLPLASFRRRVAALFIDRVLLAGLSIGLPILTNHVLTSMRLDFATISKSVVFVFWSTYASYVVYEAILLQARGQTLGKIVAKVRVVRADGRPLSVKQAWGRAMIRGIFIWFLQIINYAPATMTREKTCIHDLLARTRVVAE